MKNQSKSRRDFLLKIFSQNSKSIDDSASKLSDGEQNDKIKMLTSDGKLVEVDSRIVKKSQPSSKTNNKELLKWMTSGKQK